MEIIKQEVQGLLGACRRQTQAAWKRCKAEMFHKEAQKIRVCFSDLLHYFWSFHFLSFFFFFSRYSLHH